MPLAFIPLNYMIFRQLMIGSLHGVSYNGIQQFVNIFIMEIHPILEINLTFTTAKPSPNQIVI